MNLASPRDNIDFRADTADIGLSIVIPIYRSEKTIAALIRRLSDLTIPGGLEIVLVNDCSPDRAGSICEEMIGTIGPDKAILTYIEHAKNYGEHNAVMTGLRNASGRYIITMDDDFQNPPEEVLRLYRHALEGKWDVVYTKYKSKKHSLYRNLGSKFNNRVASILLNKPNSLYLSSFRCLSMFVARNLTAYDGPYPYIDGLILQTTNRIDSLEVDHHPRASGESGYNIWKLINLWSHLAVNFSLLPLRIAVATGGVLFALGLIGAAATVIEALNRRDLPSGWASVMTVILLLGSVQAIMLGIIGEYIGRTLLLLNQKPQATIRTIRRSSP